MSRSRIVQGGGARVQNIFLEDVMSLKSAIGEYGNPFLKPIATFSFSTHVTLYRNICCRRCLWNRVPWMSTVRQFIWERLFESTNYIIEVVKLNSVYLRTENIHKHQLRNQNAYYIQQIRTNTRKSTINFSGPKLWCTLPANLRQLVSIHQFARKKIKQLLLTKFP